MAWIGRRIEPAQNRYRWYGIDVQPTLWGTWRCVAAWGRIGQASRRQRCVCEGSFEEALQAARQHQRRKERRGYQA